MKSSLSAFELRHVVSELQMLVGGKIEKIFQQEKPSQDFLFSIHVPQLGKHHVFLSLPDVLCLSSFKPEFPSQPPAFCSSLRRKISNARITGISQHEFQRIIVFELTTKNGSSSLIIELFSSGNIILIDEAKKILATFHQKIWNENRKILHGQTYEFPSQELNPLTMTVEEVAQALSSSSKESLVTFLAIECGLGGTYAELLVEQHDFDKNQEPSKVVASKLHDAFESFFNQETAACQVGNEIYPINMKESAPLASFNEGISDLMLSKLEVQEQKEKSSSVRKSQSKFEKIIASQTKQQKGLEKAIKQNQQAGELIYNHYQELQSLLQKIKELKKTLSYKEIAQELKDNDLVVSFDEKDGTVQVNLS